MDTIAYLQYKNLPLNYGWCVLVSFAAVSPPRVVEMTGVLYAGLRKLQQHESAQCNIILFRYNVKSEKIYHLQLIFGQYLFFCGASG